MWNETQGHPLSAMTRIQRVIAYSQDCFHDILLLLQILMVQDDSLSTYLLFVVW